nr:neuropeptide CCHamide-1 receptor-like [Lytechinus pictus]
MCRNILQPAMAQLGEPSAGADTSFPNYSYDMSGNYTEAGNLPFSLAAPIFMICTVIVGTLGNGGLIYILLRNRDMRNIPNLLILNLSLGDFLYLTFNVPFYIATYLSGSVKWNLDLCRFVNAVQFISQGVSVLTLTALSTDRYYAIARPLEQRQSNSTRRTLGLAAGIWLLSTIFAIPSMALATTETGGCSLAYQTPGTRGYYASLFIFLYVIPLVLISVFYSLTAIALLKGTFKLESRVRQGGNEKRIRSRTRLAIIILIAAVCFAICWFPFYLFTLWFEFGFDPNLFIKPAMFCLFDMHYLLPILGSCLNPIILFVMSSNYRRHLRDIFRCNSTAAKRHFSSAKSWTMMSLRTNSYSLSPSSVTEMPTRCSTHLS